MFVAFEAAGADFDAATFGKLCPLEIDFFGDGAGWVVFGSANTVGVTASGHCFSRAQWTDVCHIDSLCYHEIIYDARH